MTETWVQPGESAPLSERCPPECLVLNEPRLSGRGGGLLTLYNSFLPLKPLSGFVTPSSFELSVFELACCPPVLCALCYRPPKYNSVFLNEFSDFLADFLPKYERGIILGDFNIHICCPTKPLVKEFLDILDSFDLQQLVKDPTHERSHTLDLVLSFGLCASDLFVDQVCISDHFPIIFNISNLASLPTRHQAKHCARCFATSSSVMLSSSLEAGLLTSFSPSRSVGVDGLVDSINMACSVALDSVAPLKLRQKKIISDPRLNDNTRALRRQCRTHERKWKKDKLQISQQMLKDSLAAYQKAVRSAKNNYFANIIERHRGDQRKLFSTINSVLSLKDSTAPSTPTIALCTDFQNFFLEKISTIRQNLLGPVTQKESLCSPPFSDFDPVSLQDLDKLIKSIKPSGSPLDALPPMLLLGALPVVGPFILSILNYSLSSGVFPESFKKAVVQPLLKKPGLDQNDYASFRPISKLPFLSKVIEKMVHAQLSHNLLEHSLLDHFQSAFRPNHSTESAHICVLNDILTETDAGSFVLLLLLDLSAAFDTVDHNILLTRLKSFVGVTGTALNWFHSYLSDRSFSIHIGDSSSPFVPLPWGVPQGSILGPLLFSIYILPLGNIIAKHGLHYHIYANDCQIYMALNQLSSITQLSECLSEIKTWLASNFLKFNDNKTEAILFKPKHNLHTSAAFDLSPLNLNSCVTSLGVKLDVDLSMSAHANATVRSCFFQLCRLARLKPILNRLHS
uniref:Reverse transcriptase domain-containing protein n=1 Tax=Nothobranchius furzeri TaxID=105023 RepID=A0A8C6VRF7_NOTFU